MRIPRMDVTARKLFLSVTLAALVIPTPAEGQGFNGTARTYASYIKTRGLALDSLPAESVPGQGSQRLLPDGTRATCSDTQCRYYTSGPDLDFVPLLQDLRLNVWTGITGLRAFAHVRGRQPLGDAELWPRSDEEFEALSAYVEYARSFYRVQVGRMWQTSGLGFNNYDGGSVVLRLPNRLDLQVFGGLSLVRGLNQPHRSDLISTVESLAPKEDAYLGGIHARWRPVPALAASFTYQRERMVHTEDLYSERVGGSARLLIKRVAVDMELKYDLASGETNLARLAMSTPLWAGFRGSAEVRKYLPFFELWTIWGAFSPVGYEEARGRLDWMSPSGRVSTHAYGSYRKYGETDAEAPEGYTITDHGWRLGLGGQLRVQPQLFLTGEYRYDEGYGASRSGGDVSIRRTFGRDAYLAITGTSFETFSEFRVGSGRVMGAGIQGGAPLGPATLNGGAMFYKHQQEERPRVLDLNQTRIHLSLEIPIGRDPGMAGRGNQ